MTSLVGRSDELAAIDRALRAATDGEGSALVLLGDPGIGKSSIVEAACDSAATLGLRVLRAGAALPERDLPLGLIRWLLRDAGDDLPPQLLDRAVARYELEDHVLDRLDTLLARSPCLLAVDDVQWVDEPSFAVLVALVRRAAGTPVLILLAGRHPRAGSAYEGLLAAAHHHGAARVTLGPLTDDEVAMLASARFGAAAGPGLQSALAGATGNPFYVRTLLAHLDEAGRVAVADGVAETAAATMTPTLRDAVLGPVATVGADREILQLAAVVGAGCTLGDLATLAGVEPLALWPRLEPALGAGLIVDEEGRLEFRHDLVREAVYSEIPASKRAELHRRAADVLARSGAHPTVVASHLMDAPRRRDDWAVERLKAAADVASLSAPSVAARFLRRAIELSVPDSPGSVALTGDLVMNMVWSAELEQAERLAATLTTSADAAMRGALQVAIGWASWVRGRTLDAVRLFAATAQDHSLLAGDRARAAALAAWVTAFQLGRAAEARELLQAAGTLAAESGNEMARVTIMATEHALAYLDGRPSQVADDFGRLASAANASADAGLRQISPSLLPSLMYVDADRIDDADAAIAEGSPSAAGAGPVSSAAMWHRTRAIRHFAVGEWDDALAELDALGSLAIDTGLRLGSTAGDAVAVMIAVHRGDLAEAARIDERARARKADPEYRGHWIDWAHALRLEAAGDPEGALGALADLWRRCTVDGPAVDLPWIGPDLVRLALASGDAAVVAPALAALDRLAESGPPTFHAAALHAHGLAERDVGALSAAAAAYQPGRRRFREATALLDAATIAAAEGRASHAREWVSASVSLLEALRAAPLLQQASDLQTRVSGAVPRRPSRPTQGWGSLTPSEARVARLAAEGLSNPEIATQLFVSRRTVESHMARVLQKLGLRSRVQVVRVVLEATPDPPSA